MNKPGPESDEERAKKILRAFRHLERRERLRRQAISLIWLITLILVIAIALVFFANLPKFKLLYQMLTQPDSLLLN
jgi:uncharacterized BrkB/YihY/UPF0761 family membrane protein